MRHLCVLNVSAAKNRKEKNVACTKYHAELVTISVGTPIGVTPENLFETRERHGVDLWKMFDRDGRSTLRLSARRVHDPVDAVAFLDRSNSHRDWSAC